MLFQRMRVPFGLSLFMASVIALAVLAVTPSARGEISGLDDEVTTQISAPTRANYADATPAVPPVSGGEFSTLPAKPAPAAANDNDVPGIDFSAIAAQLVSWLAKTADELLKLALLAVATWLSAKLGIKLDGFLAKKTEQAANEASAADAQHDINKDALVEKVVRDGFEYVVRRAGWSEEQLKDVKIRSAVLRELLVWLTAQWPELVEWIDQDHDGEIDFLRQKLAKAGILPASESAPPVKPAAA